jgi:hypothetical protein
VQWLSHFGNRITILSFITLINVVDNEPQTPLTQTGGDKEQSAYFNHNKRISIRKILEYAGSGRALDAV